MLTFSLTATLNDPGAPTLTYNSIDAPGTISGAVRGDPGGRGAVWTLPSGNEFLYTADGYVHPSEMYAELSYEKAVKESAWGRQMTSSELASYWTVTALKSPPPERSAIDHTAARLAAAQKQLAEAKALLGIVTEAESDKQNGKLISFNRASERE
jgi:hypothetical protein